MQSEALETLVNNHYKGLITAIASNIQDTVEANIRQWLTAEFRNQLDHHDVAFNNAQSDEWNHAAKRFSEEFIEKYLTRNEYVNSSNFDSHADEFCKEKELVTEDNLNDYLHEWMGNNFDIDDYDIEDKLKDAVRAVDFTISVS